MAFDLLYEYKVFNIPFPLFSQISGWSLHVCLWQWAYVLLH